MNQWITIAKAAGVTATAITSLFRDWTNQRKPSPNEPTLVEPDQWPVESRQAMLRFADELRSHATEPPAVFYTEFTDMWSMRDVFRNGFPEDGNPLYLVDAGDGCSLWCYELPDGGALEQYLKRQLRKKHFAEETEMFLKGLRCAHQSWSELLPNPCIVVVRRVVGGLVEDEEVVESARRVADWVETCQRETG